MYAIRSYYGQAGDTRPQAAGVAHDQIDLHPGLARAIQRLGDIHVLQRVHLQLDEAGGLRGVVLDLAFDLLDQCLFQGVGRGQYLAIARWWRVAGQIVEQLGQVLCNSYNFV